MLNSNQSIINLTKRFSNFIANLAECKMKIVLGSVIKIQPLVL